MMDDGMRIQAFIVSYDHFIIFKTMKHYLFFAFQDCENRHVTISMAESLFSCPLSSFTELMYRSLALDLSAHSTYLKSQENPEFCAGGPTTSSLRHLECHKELRKAIFHILISSIRRKLRRTAGTHVVGSATTELCMKSSIFFWP